MNTVQMAAKLYECRDTAKRLLGAKYGERMRDWGEVVTARATQEKCGVMAAGIRTARMVDGMDAVMILAATVELVEPSNAPHEGPGAAGGQSRTSDGLCPGAENGEMTRT